MNKAKINTCLVLALFFSISTFCQTARVIVPGIIHFPGSKADSIHFIKSLNGFLLQSDKANKENAYVFKKNLLETSALLDEMKGMSNGKSVAEFNLYPCYLNNVAQQDSGLVVQISFVGIKENVPVLRASFKLLARKISDSYFFFSPLARNTQNWKNKKIGSYTAFYRTAIDFGLLKLYSEKSAEFDRKLGVDAYPTDLYFCDDAQNALELLGVAFKTDYNGQQNASFYADENKQTLFVLGYASNDSSVFDIHDCWHNRLRNAVKPGTVNRFIDEGCAYLYGGSWGYSWQYILDKFKATFPGHQDWLAIYRENKQFGSSQAKHLYAAYVINALLAKKLEGEKGFPAVKQFLCSGPKQKDDLNYFAVLEKLDGITENNFSSVVEKLVRKEK